MQNMLNWYIILTITYKGPEISVELDELQDAIKRFELTTEFSHFLGLPITDTLMRLSRKTVLKHYAPGVKEWGDVIERFDNLDSVELEEISKDQVEDDLASWLDDLHIDSEEDRSRACLHPKINPSMVELYRCSWCGNPSAILRKCRACGLTRYCDAHCQKQHWSKHKVACKLATPAN